MSRNTNKVLCDQCRYVQEQDTFRKNGLDPNRFNRWQREDLLKTMESGGEISIYITPTGLIHWEEYYKNKREEAESRLYPLQQCVWFGFLRTLCGLIFGGSFLLFSIFVIHESSIINDFYCSILISLYFGVLAGFYFPRENKIVKKEFLLEFFVLSGFLFFIYSFISIILLKFYYC